MEGKRVPPKNENQVFNSINVHVWTQSQIQFNNGDKFLDENVPGEDTAEKAIAPWPKKQNKTKR